MARVVIENLVKTYPDKSGAGVTAVKGISLAVEDGEFMVLVGPSGCGKSTTLRMIAGLEEITGGTIAIDGKVVNDALPKDRDIAMVFQNYALYPHMTVFENMAFGLKLRKFPRAEIESRVREAAELLGLGDHLTRRPATLSGGQRQRVAVGRAIVRRPKVFLFDEPLSNLDAKMRGSMRSELARLHARLGATMIYVTHDQVEAMTMGDRICVMRDGAIMQVSGPLDLYRHPENLFVAGFIGSPPMNFFRGTIRSDGPVFQFVENNPAAAPLVLALPPQLSARAASAAGRPVVLGIRPEDIHDAAEPGPAGASVPVEARVDLVEPLGAETHLHLHTGASEFIARVDPAGDFHPDRPARLAFDLTRAQLFDAATGQLLKA